MNSPVRRPLAPESMPIAAEPTPTPGQAGNQVRPGHTDIGVASISRMTIRGLRYYLEPMEHHSVGDFDKRLGNLFDEVDDYLEEKYGGEYPLHPSRPARGKTSSKSQDGLFNVGASFSAGYHSDYGRGYSIDVDMVTLEWVSKEEEEEILEDAVAKIRELLGTYFPKRNLEVKRDRRTFKIVGDLSLGEG